MATAFDLLHRNVQRKLWDMGWTELRSIQEHAIRHVLIKRSDAIIASPTASGKTEAAFLPVLSDIADSPFGSVRAMYVGPLKALINDQFGRVEDLCTRLEMPVCKWHGDVGDSAKQRLLDSPGGVLLITPESIEALLVRRPTSIPKLFSKLAFVVVDEMHAFMGSERGAQLVSQLHRLCRRAGCDPLRIGLSATLGEPESALRWLRPRGPVATLIHDTSASAALRMKVRGIWHRPPTDGDEASGDDSQDDQEPVYRELAAAILQACAGKTNLVFANAKARIERLADALTTQVAEAKLPDEVVVHHGSLSRERRLHAEERLRQATACTAVCTNTLELGIDIGRIDQVVQVSAPWSVASLVQRVGRSGRRDDVPKVFRGFFVERVPDENTDVWDRLHLDLVQGLATIELMLEKFIEPPALHRPHLSTVVHQCLAHLAETGGTSAGALYKIIHECGAFGDLTKADFAALLREMGRHDLIEQMGDSTLILGIAGQKIVEHYSFFAAFNAPEELRVVHGADEIGTIHLPPAPGEHLILAGRRWRVESIEVERREVVVTPARGMRAPYFVPSRGRIHPAVHAKMKQVLLGTEIPSYLDSVATDMLQKAREHARKLGGFRPVAVATANGARLFVFGGSKVQETLGLVLSKAGAKVTDFDVGFDVEGNSDAIAKALRAFAASGDLAALADHADRIQNKRILGSEKFERFLAPEVWQRAYARDALDGPNTAAIALALADVLTVGAPPADPLPSERPALSNAARDVSLEKQTQILGSTADWAAAVAALPRDGPLPASIVVVPSNAVAHALRKELIRGGWAACLRGTRFVGASILAREVLSDAGIDFVGAEESLRPSRILRLIRQDLSLEYFDRDLLTRMNGWDEAFARTIGDLEAAGLSPEDLPSDAEPQWRDVARVWRAANASGGRSWTENKILREAAQLLELEPTRWHFNGAVLVAVTGHEASAHARFIRAIPRAHIAVHGARPARDRHRMRVKRLYAATAPLPQSPAVPRAHATERDVLASYLFEPADVLAAADRPRSGGVDGTVSLEEHAGIEAEVEASAEWVSQQICERATPIEEIAILTTRLDPLAALLVDRLSRLFGTDATEAPIFVAGGLPARTSPPGARMSAVIRALRGHLSLDGLAGVLPVLRAGSDEVRVPRGAALDVAYALGTAGGNPAHPKGALEWTARVAAEVTRHDAVLNGTTSDDEESTESSHVRRRRAHLLALQPAIDALVGVAQALLDGAPLSSVWPLLRDFFEVHLVAPGSSPITRALLEEAMTVLCLDEAGGALQGDDALAAIDESLDRLRIPVGRVGEAAIYVGGVESAVGLRFRATRIIGLAEGTIPAAPMEDPVLPAHLRTRFESLGLIAPADRTLAQLHAIDRVARDTSECIAMSHSRQGADRSYREASSVLIEAAAALGRGVANDTAPVIPDRKALHRHAYGPARATRAAFRSKSPLLGAAWLDRVATGAPGVPRDWLVGSHVQLSRVRELMTEETGALHGFLDTARDGLPLSIPGLTAERTVSPSALASLLACPHQFLLERVFRLGAPFAPPPQRSLPANVYGNLVHTCLERFYRENGPAFSGRRETLDKWLSSAVLEANRVFDQYLETTPLTSEGVRRAQRERVIEDVKRFVRHDWSQPQADFVDVERPFNGVVWRDANDRLHLHLRGRIDRIDAHASRVTIVRDVKTGKPHPRAEDEAPDVARDLQLAVYSYVARASTHDWKTPQRVSAEYVYVGPRGIVRRSWNNREDILAAAGDDWLSLAAELMTAGTFPRTTDPDDCRYCSFQPTCGEERHVTAARALVGASGVLKRFADLKGAAT